VPTQFTPPQQTRQDDRVCVVSGTAVWIGQLLWTCSDFKFSVSNSLELRGIQFTPPKWTQHRQDSLVMSRVAVWISFKTICICINNRNEDKTIQYLHLRHAHNQLQEQNVRHRKRVFRDSNTSHAHKNWAVTYKCRGFQLRHVIHVLSLWIPGRLWPKLRPICWPLTGSHTQIYTTPDRQTDSRHTGTFLGIHRKQLNAISN